MTPIFYIYHGQDDLRIDEAVEAIVSEIRKAPNAELNTSRFDGTSTPVGEILGAAAAYPFLAAHRLVIVKDLLAHIGRRGAGETGKKALELLAAELPHLPDWARVIFIEREKLPDSHRIVKLADGKRGVAKAFDVPKDSTDWIVKRAKDYGAVIEPMAASALATVTQGDLRRADNELIKLISFTEAARPITEDDVAHLTPYMAEARTFDIVDALAEGRAQKAAVLLHRLLEQQGDDQVFALYFVVVSHFRNLLLVKEHIVTGGSARPPDIAAALHLKPYPAEKFARQSRNFSLEQLETIYRRLYEYDVQIKTGRITPLLALDLLIAVLAR